MLYSSNRIGVWKASSALAACITLAACGATTSDDAGDAVEVATGHGEAPETITDPDGKVWVATRGVQSYDSSPIVEPDDSHSQDRPDTAYSLEELTERLRPIMEFGGVEYELSDADAREFARAIQNTALEHETTGGMLSDISRGPDGESVADTPFEVDAGRVDKAVFGGDGREMIWDPSSRKPWHWIASQGTSKCTVFKMIDNYTAVTAAHCQHTGSSWKSRQTLQFGASASSPSRYAELASGCYARTVPGCWDGDDRACDYAVIRLRGGGPWCNYDDYNVGKFGYQSVGGCVSNINGSVAGYPGDSSAPSGSWSFPEMWWHQNSTGRTECAGINPNKVWYENDTSEGQSGAPYWTFSDDTRYVRGIHFGAKSNKNGARRITSSLISWLKSNSGY